MCVHTALACVGGRGPQTAASWGRAWAQIARGIGPARARSGVCVRARAWVTWRGESCGWGPGETLGLRNPHFASRRPPDPAGCPPTRWRRGLVWLGLEEPRALARCPPHAPRLTLGPGRSVGARARACCRLRRSWRESARSAHPLPIFRPGDSGGRRLSGLTGPGPSPALPPAPLPGAQPAACLCRLCPLGAGSLRPEIISQARGPRAKGGSRWSCGLRGGWRLPMAKVTQHERR